MINEDRSLSDGHLSFRLEVEVPASVVGEDTAFGIREFVDEEWFKEGFPPSVVEEILDDILENLKSKIIASLMERISAKRNGSQ